MDGYPSIFSCCGASFSQGREGIPAVPIAPAPAEAMVSKPLSSYWTMHYAFSMLNPHRIELEVDSTNRRALRFYENWGLSAIGVQRQHWYDNHQHLNSTIMSISEDDDPIRYP